MGEFLPGGRRAGLFVGARLSTRIIAPRSPGITGLCKRGITPDVCASGKAPLCDIADAAFAPTGWLAGWRSSIPVKRRAICPVIFLSRLCSPFLTCCPPDLSVVVY